jgi:hypothetical protein
MTKTIEELENEKWAINHVLNKIPTLPPLHPEYNENMRCRRILNNRLKEIEEELKVLSKPL